MAAFLVLSGNYRIGASGTYKITANEVEICRQRLSPAHFNRATIIAEVFAPAQAVEAGFLDRVVDEAELDQAARSAASELAQLDVAAHSATKLRARKATLETVHEAIDLDSAAYAAVLAR